MQALSCCHRNWVIIFAFGIEVKKLNWVKSCPTTHILNKFPILFGHLTKRDGWIARKEGQKMWNTYSSYYNQNVQRCDQDIVASISVSYKKLNSTNKYTGAQQNIARTHGRWENDFSQQGGSCGPRNHLAFGLMVSQPTRPTL